MNVVFILIDALRNDTLEQNLHKLPNLKRIAEQGTFVSKTYAHSSWTKTSIASIFTSTNPATHQVYTVVDSVPQNLPTLAEKLKEENYLTACITNNVFFIDGSGFDRGFEIVKYTGSDEGETINKAFLNIMEKRDKNVFAYLHYMNVHPYVLARKARKYAYATGIKLLNVLPNTIRDIQLLNLSKNELDCLKEVYEQEIQYTDKLIGEIIEYLENNSLLKETILIITSDHGVEFGEHGGLYHGNSLYESNIRTPLILFHPEKKIACEDLVRGIDFAPTILDILNFKSPASFQGTSLVSSQERREENLVLYAEKYTFPSVWMKSIIRGKWKLIKNEKIEKRKIIQRLLHHLKEGNFKIFKSIIRGTLRILLKTLKFSRQTRRKRELYELYNLHNDQNEVNNLYAKERKIAEKLKSLLEEYEKKYVNKTKRDEEIQHTKEIEEHLKALGYLD